MNHPLRCSDAARERCDPLAGTAAPSRGWLLVEHPGPWAPDALAGSGIAPEVQEHLRVAAQQAGARVLLVRKPGRQPETAQRSWMVRWSDPDRQGRDGLWATDADLLGAVDALREDVPAATGSQDPLLLVCTHGRHDTCCAVRGRPVAASLAERWPEQTWECSHVGGDRFAANLVVVPDGTYYGAVDDTAVVDLVDRHLGGRVTPEHLRGFTSGHPWEQAAVVEAHARRGPFGARDVVLDRSSPSQVTGPARWKVHLLIEERGREPVRVIASVTRTVGDAHLLTCRATHPAAVAEYEVSLVDG